MSEELKACPFCGSDAITTWYGKRAVIWCSNETCPMMNVDTGDLPIDEAKTHWNTRPLEDALRKQLEDLSINYKLRDTQVDALLAKLEKAKEALSKTNMRLQALCGIPEIPPPSNDLLKITWNDVKEALKQLEAE